MNDVQINVYSASGGQVTLIHKQVSTIIVDPHVTEPDEIYLKVPENFFCFFFEYSANSRIFLKTPKILSKRPFLRDQMNNSSHWQLGKQAKNPHYNKFYCALEGQCKQPT
jgi:hypothetical protein